MGDYSRGVLSGRSWSGGGGSNPDNNNKKRNEEPQQPHSPQPHRFLSEIQEEDEVESVKSVKDENEGSTKCKLEVTINEGEKEGAKGSKFHIHVFNI